MQFAEPVAALLARFRLVEVVPRDDTPAVMPADPRWLPHGTAGRTLRFVDTRHDEPDAASRIAAAFPVCDIRTSQLPLREIFVILARASSTHRWRSHEARVSSRPRGRAPVPAAAGDVGAGPDPWTLSFTGVRPALAADPRLMTAIDVMGTVLLLTRWLGLFLIVPLVVQTHPLVGSDAFWMTRPIPWRALFASKIILLGTTFVAVPALCEVVLMLAFRVPIAEIAFVTLQTLLFQALWLLFVMALSATTRDLARFALVGGGVLVALVLLVSTSLAVMLRSMPDGPQLSAVTGRAASGPAAGVVMLLLLITAAVVPLVVQYRTRSARTSVAAGVAGISVAVLIGTMWPSHRSPFRSRYGPARNLRFACLAKSQRGEFRRTRVALESPGELAARACSTQAARDRAGLARYGGACRGLSAVRRWYDASYRRKRVLVRNSIRICR